MSKPSGSAFYPRLQDRSQNSGFSSVKPSARVDPRGTARRRQDPILNTRGGWDPYSAIPNYHKLPDQTVFRNGQWVYGKDAYGTPFRRATGGDRKNGQMIYVTEIPNKKKEARKAYAERMQGELNLIAAERRAIANQQAKRLERLKRSKAAFVQAQKDKVKSLKRNYRAQAEVLETATNSRVAKINKKSRRKVRRMRRRSRRRIRNLNITNNASASSLRILGRGMADPGPGAQQSRRVERTRGAKNTSTGLRIGSQVNTSGANFSV